MTQRSSLSSSYVALPSLASLSSAERYCSRGSLSTYAPPILKDRHSQPFLPSLDEDTRPAALSLALSPSSRPSSSSSASRSSRPVTSQLSTPASSLRSSLSSPNSRQQSRQGRRATFVDSLPPLDSANGEEAIDENAEFDSPHSNRSSLSAPLDTAEWLLQQADEALAEEDGTDQQDTLLLRRQRTAILAQLKRADRERGDMARELYDEMQMAMEEVAAEEAHKKAAEREQREKAEEKKRLKDERRREKKEADLIETLSAQQMINILDCFPASAAHTTPPQPTTPTHSYNLSQFVATHHSLHHLMFRNAPQSCVESAVITVDWCQPPHFHHVLSRHLAPTSLPAFLHGELDVLDPSSEALLAFLASWLRSYANERPSFASLSNFLALKLSELSAVTARLASPNSLLTFISIDAMLRFISSLPMDQTRVQVLMTLMLDLALLGVYTKHNDTGTGRLRVRDETYSTRVRTLDALLSERKEEHRRMARRMQSMHEQWIKVLRMWQPAVARAISRWQLPIKALTFQSWLATHHKRRWRLSEGERSMSTLVRALRRRWDMRHNLRVAFLEWKQQAISTRLTRLQDELRTLSRINGDKGATLQRLTGSSEQYGGECRQREKEVEEGVLRTEMLKVQHSEYDEMLQVYGVQEEEAARLVDLFGALMLRGVEEYEVQAVQTYHGHWHDINQLGDIEPLQDNTADGEALAGMGEGGGSNAEKKKKSRQLLASLVNKKKASAISRSSKSKKDQDQSDNRSFLRVWTAYQYQRFADLFASSAFTNTGAPQIPDADVVLISSAASQQRYESLIAPLVPAAFSSSVELDAGARSHSAYNKRRSTAAAAASGLEVAASFLNALRSLEHAPFPLPPSSSPECYLAHHSHERIICVDQADEDEQQRSDREQARRSLKEATDSAEEPAPGMLAPNMQYLLSLSYADGQQALPSLFSFMPDIVFPLPMPHPLPTPYAMPFAQPATVRAPHFILQAILAMPQFHPQHDSDNPSAPVSHSSHAVSHKAGSNQPQSHHQDVELFHASCLSLLYSYPCLPFDWDEELCHISELSTLAQSLATSPRHQLMRLHSDVMRVVLQLMRAWRKRMNTRRKQLSEGQRLFVAHVRHAEEDVTKRLMRKIREKDSLKSVMLPQQADKDAEAGVRTPTLTGSSEPAALGRVEDAFGSVEEETFVELSLDDDSSGAAADGKKTQHKKRKDRHGKKNQPAATNDTEAHNNNNNNNNNKSTAAVAANTSAAAASTPVNAASNKGGAEYEAEKAEDEAESAELRYDGERLREVSQQCIDRIKQKALEDKEKKDKKSKKKANATSPSHEADGAAKDASAADGETGGVVDGAGETKEVTTVLGDDEDEDALFGEDESVQCEELISKYIGEIRRVYRNSCETDDAQASPALLPKTLPTAVNSPSLAPSRLPGSTITAAAALPAPVWCMSKVHLGRLVRKYKMLGKACSAQFIDQLWDDKQTAKRAASTLTISAVGDGNDSGAASTADGGDGWINFDDFLELLLRIATHKYSSTAPTLLARLSALLTLDLFPSLNRPSPLADFRTSIALTCEPTFDKHNKFLSTVFRAYSSDRESNGGVQEPAMTRKDFDEFIEGTGLVQRKVIAVRTVAVLWGSAQMDDDEAGSGGSGSGSGGGAGADLFGGSSSMVFWEFLESIAAMACFYDRDPFLPVETRVDAFIEYLQDGCPAVETKRRMYTAKQGQGAGGSGTVGAAVAKGKAQLDSSSDNSPAITRPSTASKR